MNTALPAISRDFGARVSDRQWTVDGYTLVLAVLLTLSGSLADRFRRRRLFHIGLAVFVAGSLRCSAASSTGWLVVFRMLRAVGGSMLNPVALSIITTAFVEPRERARTLGVWGAVGGVSLALAPLVGGVLVSSAGWRSIFWVNAPIGVAAIVLTRLLVSESRSDRPRRPDLFGQALLAVTLAALITAIIEAPDYGWASGTVVALLVVAAASGIALVAVESRRREPVIDLRFFRSASFSGATATAFASFAALNGFLFLNALDLQEARGFTALEAGLLTLPMAVPAAVLAPLSGRLVAARGPRLPLVLAGAAVVAGALPLITVTPRTPLVLIAGAYLLLGAGFGVVNAPVSQATLAGIPASRTTVAAAIASTSRQTGAAVGVAVAGSITAAGIPGIAGGAGVAAAGHPAWAVVAGLGLVVLLLGVITTTKRARAASDRVGLLVAGQEEHAGA